MPEEDEEGEVLPDGRRNPIAKDLRTPKYAKRVEKAKKGKGSYRRMRDEQEEEG